MNIHTFSIVTGGTACNARCPFCISRMTGNMDVQNHPTVNWRNLDKACRLAKRAGASTAMLTGKGEPTLWSGLITEYIRRLDDYFPIIELQTNGLLLPAHLHTGKVAPSMGLLNEWYDLGLTTIAISVVHWDSQKNKEIYTPNREYMNLPALIKDLHGIGFTVRLCCVMAGGYIDDFPSTKKMIQFARNNKVEHLTFTPVNSPGFSSDSEAEQWVSTRLVDQFAMVEPIIHGLEMECAVETMRLPHGARVFDCDGQNVCFNNCLNAEPADLQSIRNLIFFPDGRVRHKWDAEGSIIF